MATAGVAGGTVLFSTPGSSNAVKLAMEKLIKAGHRVARIATGTGDTIYSYSGTNRLPVLITQAVARPGISDTFVAPSASALNPSNT